MSESDSTAVANEVPVVTLAEFQERMALRTEARGRVQQLLDLLGASAVRASVTVPLAEFGLWLALMGAQTFTVSPWKDAGLHAHIQEQYAGKWIQVHTFAEEILGYPMPTEEGDGRFVEVLAQDVDALRDARVARELNGGQR
jgi:hypothetical protein